jgi:hypothetical protein
MSRFVRMDRCGKQQPQALESFTKIVPVHGQVIPVQIYCRDRYVIYEIVCMLVNRINIGAVRPDLDLNRHHGGDSNDVCFLVLLPVKTVRMGGCNNQPSVRLLLLFNHFTYATVHKCRCSHTQLLQMYSC